jgi:hypothetical protein
MPAAGRLALLAALALAACGGPPEDPVERLVHELSSAAQDRDAAAVGEHLAADFRGEGGMGKAEAVATVRRSLAGYDRIGVEVFDLQREEAGRVRFRVDFSGKPKDVGGLAGLLPEAAVYEFELELSGEDSALEVRSAGWRPWTPPASR